jgi:hypothetical protein
LKEPQKALAQLLVSEILAPLESSFAALYGLDEAGFLLKIARKRILYQLVGAAALQGGRCCQLRFQFPCNVHFHFGGSLSENTLLHYRSEQAGLDARNHSLTVVAR